jgi:hypothetical protein
MPMMMGVVLVSVFIIVIQGAVSWAPSAWRRSSTTRAKRCWRLDYSPSFACARSEVVGSFVGLHCMYFANILYLFINI